MFSDRSAQVSPLARQRFKNNPTLTGLREIKKNEPDTDCDSPEPALLLFYIPHNA
jgi:hypothetical protein